MQRTLWFDPMSAVRMERLDLLWTFLLYKLWSFPSVILQKSPHSVQSVSSYVSYAEKRGQLCCPSPTSGAGHGNSPHALRKFAQTLPSANTPQRLSRPKRRTGAFSAWSYDVSYGHFMPLAGNRSIQLLLRVVDINNIITYGHGEVPELEKKLPIM